MKENVILTYHDLEIRLNSMTEFLQGLLHAFDSDRAVLPHLNHTQLQEGLEAIQESQSLLTSTLDLFPAYIAILDDHGNIFAVNSVWRTCTDPFRFIGATYAEGANFFDICTHAHVAGVANADIIHKGLQTIISTQHHSLQSEYPSYSLDGKRWFLLRMTRFPVKDLSRICLCYEEITEYKRMEEELQQYRDHLGELVEVHTTELTKLNYQLQREIRECKQTEAHLQEKETQLRFLFEHTLNPIFVVNGQGCYLDANAATLEFLECSKEELLSKKVWDFVPPGQMEQQQELFSYSSPHRLKTDYYVHGKIKTLLLNVVPLSGSSGQMLYSIGVDVTEHKK